MNTLVITFVALVACVQAAPQLFLSAGAYAAFQRALGHRVPVNIQSAVRVLSSEEYNPTDFVRVNFDGSSEEGFPVATPVDYDSDELLFQARTGTLPADDVADTVNEVAEAGVNRATVAKAIEGVVANTAEGTVDNRAALENAIEDEVASTAERTVDNTETAAAPAVATEARTAAADNTPSAEENSIDSASNDAAVSTPAEDSQANTPVDDNQANAQANDSQASVQVEDSPANAPADESPVQETTTAAVESEMTEAVAESRTGLAAGEQEGTQQVVAAALESARRKRQDDDGNNSKYANTLSFALQFLGLEIGSDEES